jgi:hypothetical protein
MLAQGANWQLTRYVRVWRTHARRRSTGCRYLPRPHAPTARATALPTGQHSADRPIRFGRGWCRYP